MYTYKSKISLMLLFRLKLCHSIPSGNSVGISLYSLFFFEFLLFLFINVPQRDGVPVVESLINCNNLELTCRGRRASLRVGSAGLTRRKLFCCLCHNMYHFKQFI